MKLKRRIKRFFRKSPWITLSEGIEKLSKMPNRETRREWFKKNRKSFEQVITWASINPMVDKPEPIRT
jgi:hypothetical protein